MKRILFILILLLTTVAPSLEDYNYPIENPLEATIIGSSTFMTEEKLKEPKSKDYELEPFYNEEIPEPLWYQDKFRFSLAKQDKKAPLIFILAGTGTAYDAWKMKAFEKIFYNQGYHVIRVSSSFNSNFIVTASKNQVPGLATEDSKDVLEAMKKAYEKVAGDIEVDGFYMTGYSMGATQAAFISYYDEEDKYFDFERVFMINPSKNLYDSAIILDNMLDDNVPGGRKNLGKFIDGIVDELLIHVKGQTAIDEDTLYRVFQDDFLTDNEIKALIGLSFRFAAIDINYIVDLLRERGVYTVGKPDKFQSMSEVFNKINGASFAEYITNIAYPEYKKIYSESNLTLEELIKISDLEYIDEYIRSSDKLAMVTNEDELILTSENLSYLKDAFKGKSVIYPRGGHCGNMYYKDNIDVMLRFINKGVLLDEK